MPTSHAKGSATTKSGPGGGSHGPKGATDEVQCESRVSMLELQTSALCRQQLTQIQTHHSHAEVVQRRPQLLRNPTTL